MTIYITYYLSYPVLFLILVYWRFITIVIYIYTSPQQQKNPKARKLYVYMKIINKCVLYIYTYVYSKDLVYTHTHTYIYTNTNKHKYNKNTKEHSRTYNVDSKSINQIKLNQIKSSNWTIISLWMWFHSIPSHQQQQNYFQKSPTFYFYFENSSIDTQSNHPIIHSL